MDLDLKVCFMKTKVFILSIISLLSFFNIAFASDSEICDREIENNNYTRAFQYCEKACHQYSGEDCRKLGWLYKNGHGVKQDYKQAKNYYEKACDLKNGTGCNNIGWIYQNGYGVKQDYKQAKNYYEKACDLKNATGCKNLGLLYSEGNGVEKDEIFAMKYFIKACRFGNKSACEVINNAKMSKDQINCFEKDDVDACFGAAATALNFANFKWADLFFKRACELGREDACIFYKNAGEAVKEQAKEMRNNR